MQATAPATMAIIGIDIFVFVLQMLLGQEVTSTLLLSPFLVDQGEWWRLLTPLLVHAGALHLFLNMYILFLYGPNVEQAFGTIRFIVMFLVAGFMGSAFSYAFPPENASVGASGAIFGIVGVLVVYLYRRRTSHLMAHYLRGMTFFIVANLAFGFLLSSRIDNFAHIGGLLGGALMALGFDRGQTSEARSPLGLQIATTVVVTAIGLLLVLA